MWLLDFGFLGQILTLIFETLKNSVLATFYFFNSDAYHRQTYIYDMCVLQSLAPYVPITIFLQRMLVDILAWLIYRSESKSTLISRGIDSIYGHFGACRMLLELVNKVQKK